MATYAIGDIQGCYDELQKLLVECGFSRRKDTLWFVGDLVNRGPKSLEVLRFVRDLGERAVVVLGNHDLHLVTQYEGFERTRKDDTFGDVLAAPDAKDLVDWLRTRPLIHSDDGYVMIHAGLLPSWTVADALVLGAEVERALRAPDYRSFLTNLYGNKPDRWNESLTGWDRLRVIVNAMTRMRFCTQDGRMEFQAEGATPPAGFLPWYETRSTSEPPIVFGHWSDLGLRLDHRASCLDSGCVWGGFLSALRLEDRALVQVPCSGYLIKARGGQ